MIYPIVVYGSPILRKVSKEIPQDYENLPELIESMFETMYNADGVGLAAPQIGKNIRLFVIDAKDMDEEDDSLKNFKKVFINPKIVNETGIEWSFNEGCLSIPNIREDIVRLSEIRIQYYDEEFNFYDEKYSGTKARVIQHEYDHLEGILFVDKISSLRKRLLNGKLKAITKGTVSDLKYKIKVPG